jgi:hypothetical protein
MGEYKAAKSRGTADPHGNDSTPVLVSLYFQRTANGVAPYPVHVLGAYRGVLGVYERCTGVY